MKVMRLGPITNCVTARTLAMTTGFWLGAFVINEVMSVLRGELPFELAGSHRAAAFAFGAFLAFVAAHFLAQMGRDVRRQTAFALATIILMPALHAVFFFFTCKVAPIPGVAAMTVSEAVVKALLSTGYFSTWIVLQIALNLSHDADDGKAEERSLEAPVVPAAEIQFAASCHNRRVQVRLAEIRWVEAQRDYAILHCATRRCIMRTTLSDLSIELGGDFLQIHRSAIVRCSLIASLHRRSSGAHTLRTTCGARLPVGRSYLSDVREVMEDGQFSRTFVAGA